MMKESKRRNKKISLKERFVKNSFYSFLNSIINRAGALIFTIILARMLKPEGYGLYSLTLSIAMIFMTFTDLGLTGTFIRYLSFAIKREKKKINAYYRYILRIKLYFSLSASALLFILSYPISHYAYKNPNLFLPLLIASAYIFISSLESFYSSIFYSLEKVRYLTVRELLNQSLRIIFASLVLIFLTYKYQVSGIFASFVAISSLLLIYSFSIARKILPHLFIKSKAKIDKRKVKKFAFFLIIASISSIFFSYVDTIMLGFFVATKYIGYYKAAFSLVYGIGGLLGFFTVLLVPIFTKLEKKKKESVLNKILKFSSAITIPSVFFLLILGNYFLVLFYGYDYLPAKLPLFSLSFLIFLTISTNIFLSLFSSEEKPQIFAKLIIITTLLNIILNFVLIKSFVRISQIYGVFGASLATTLSWFFYFFSTLYYSKKELKLTFSLSVTKPIIASLIMTALIFSFLKFIKDMNIFIGIILVLISLFIYIASLFLMKEIKKEDFKLIRILLIR